MERRGIDISAWQGSNVDFNKLKADGIEFVILRAGFGTSASQKDSQFENNYRKAKAAGMPIGAYWYSYAYSVEDAKKEAKAFQAVLAGKQLEYPVYYDVEDPTQVSLGKTTLTNMVLEFGKSMEIAKYWAGFYSNLNWMRNYLDYNVLKRFTFWLAQWAPQPTFEGDFAMWQYSSTGRTSGTPGNTDMDIVYIDFPKYIKEGGLNGFSKSTPAEPVTTTTTTTTTTTSTNEIVYTVVRGDTLFDIATKYGTTSQKLAEYNGIADPDVIYVGQKIKIPANTSTTTTTSTSSNAIVVGNKVRVKKGAPDYNGGQLAPYVYDTVYDVLEVNGDRVVIGIGNAVTAAVKMSNLYKV